MSAADKFKKDLGAEVCQHLGSDFKFLRSKRELRRPSGNGHDVVILSGSNKWSPHISVAFYYGRNYDDVKSIEKLAGEEPMPYHIQQYSPNATRISGLDFAGTTTWEVDITGPPAGLAKDIAAAIRGVAFPFFARFTELKTARDALATEDTWCFGAAGSGWYSLLKLDAALRDFEHFEVWRECLNEFYYQQSEERLLRYKELLE